MGLDFLANEQLFFVLTPTVFSFLFCSKLSLFAPPPPTVGPDLRRSGSACPLVSVTIFMLKVGIKNVKVTHLCVQSLFPTFDPSSWGAVTCRSVEIMNRFVVQPLNAEFQAS